jgi:spermidine synthase
MIVEEFRSKYSGKLFVKKIWDWGWKYHVSTGLLTQSGGIINDLWKPVIKNLKLEIKNCLILGLATGTLAKMLKRANITGYEIDPVMIAVGKKYFGLDKISNLKIINQDAQDFRGNFDVIFVDLYLGDKPPSFLYSHKYLKKLKERGKVVIINHLFYDQGKKNKAEKLIKKLERYFSQIELKRVLTNVIISCHV